MKEIKGPSVRDGERNCGWRRDQGTIREEEVQDSC